MASPLPSSLSSKLSQSVQSFSKPSLLLPHKYRFFIIPPQAIEQSKLFSCLQYPQRLVFLLCVRNHAKAFQSFPSNPFLILSKDLSSPVSFTFFHYTCHLVRKHQWLSSTFRTNSTARVDRFQPVCSGELSFGLA